jgi:inosine-uridine nucleoside N-ribohydrolase
MSKNILIVLTIFLFTVFAGTAQVKIIFDTDFGGDADDLGALAMLHNLHNAGECELLGIANWSTEQYVIPAMDAVNRFNSQHELPLYKDSPVIYDNDDHRDVYTDEYLLALSSIGEVDLKGVITTYSPNEYPNFVEGRKQIMDLAIKSGLKHLPELFSGTNRKLDRPDNNKIEDTKPLDIDGSHFIVKIARKCSSSKPLVIITGGQLTSVANAYLIDPSIADKVVVMGVFGANNIDYNAGLDAWAWTIILAKFRTVAIPIGPSDNRGVVYMKPPKVPKERILAEIY